MAMVPIRKREFLMAAARHTPTGLFNLKSNTWKKKRDRRRKLPVLFRPCSGKIKPDPQFYLEVVGHLGVEPCDCIFIDDRPTNVKCAIEIGMGGLCFENADSLAKDLSHLDINLSVPGI